MLYITYEYDFRCNYIQLQILWYNKCISHIYVIWSYNIFRLFYESSEREQYWRFTARYNNKHLFNIFIVFQEMSNSSCRTSSATRILVVGLARCISITNPSRCFERLSISCSLDFHAMPDMRKVECEHHFIDLRFCNKCVILVVGLARRLEF